MTLVSRTLLDRYEVLAPLGAGGMGEVYRARDLRLGREVAIKVLRPACRRSPERAVLARVDRAILDLWSLFERQPGLFRLALE